MVFGIFCEKVLVKMMEGEHITKQKKNNQGY